MVVRYQVDVRKLRDAIRYVNNERKNGFPNRPKGSPYPFPGKDESPEAYKARYKAWNQEWKAIAAYDNSVSKERASKLYSLMAYVHNTVHMQKQYVPDYGPEGRMILEHHDFAWQESFLAKSGLFEEFGNGFVTVVSEVKEFEQLVEDAAKYKSLQK